MWKRLLISVMALGLLVGCMQDDEEPQLDEQPIDEEIQEDIDQLEEDADDMLDEGDLEKEGIDQELEDTGDTGGPSLGESENGGAEEPAAPEEDDKE